MTSSEILKNFKNDVSIFLNCQIDQSVSKQAYELSGSINCLLYVKTRSTERANWGITASVIDRLKKSNKPWFVVLLSINQNNGYFLTEKDIDFFISNNLWKKNEDRDYKTSTSFSSDKSFNSLKHFALLLEKNINQERNIDDIISETIRISQEERTKKSVESTRHKKLKKLIADNPKLIGLTNIKNTYMEYSYPSGDRVDIAFEFINGNWSVIEIELSGLSETVTGLFQTIKYKALQTALLKTKGIKGEVSGYLVANYIPKETKEFAKLLDVKAYEIQL
ncbi:MAG TPA: hypothetical protein VM123_20280 [archaeon]|nr:hypothetical protein [archaeon]